VFIDSDIYDQVGQKRDKFYDGRRFLQLLDRNQKVIYHQDFEDNGDIPKVEINSISDLDAEEYDIGPPDRSVSKITQYSSSRKKRMGPVTKKEYEMVIQLHNCLGHMNPAKMSQAIREGHGTGLKYLPHQWIECFYTMTARRAPLEDVINLKLLEDPKSSQ
jgi:hypothetical protein